MFKKFGKGSGLKKRWNRGLIARMAVVCLVCLSGRASAQQQFSYTQYADNLTPINPAWSLTRPRGEVNMLGRKQWVGIDGAPSTYMLNGFVPLNSIGATVGAFLMKDKVAIEDLSEFNAFFAKSIALDENLYLAVSLNGGFRKYDAAYSALDPNDPVVQNSDIHETEANMGASVMTYIPGRFFAGISLPRLSIQDLAKASVSSSRHYKKFYYLTAGFEQALSDGIQFRSSALVAYTANVPLQADVSFKTYFMETVGLGLNYRSNNELAALASVNINNTFKFGYSYQFGFGATKITGLSKPTHEITLGVAFGEISDKFSNSSNVRY